MPESNGDGYAAAAAAAAPEAEAVEGASPPTWKRETVRMTVEEMTQIRQLLDIDIEAFAVCGRDATALEKVHALLVEREQLAGAAKELEQAHQILDRSSPCDREKRTSHAQFRIGMVICDAADRERRLGKQLRQARRRLARAERLLGVFVVRVQRLTIRSLARKARLKRQRAEIKRLRAALAAAPKPEGGRE